MAGGEGRSKGYDPARQRWLIDSLRTLMGVGLGAATLAVYQRQARALPATAIRPPGAAVDEQLFQGACIRCGLCVRDCPYDTLVREKACILDEAAIKVFPIALAKGLLGEHYRLGWEQKARAGESLVTPDPPHRYNLPEGMQYEHGGRGLIPAEPGLPPPPAVPDAESATLPFSSNPLETLNRKGGL
jgi:ferredoxin